MHRLSWMRDLAAGAKRVVAIGACAGRSVTPFVDPRRLMTIPGCPAAPEEILLTLATTISAAAQASVPAPFPVQGRWGLARLPRMRS